MAPRKRLQRHIKIKGSESASERAARTAARYIMDNPAYPLILKAIRSGTPNSQIAEWAITRGYADVNQKTLVGYLQYFRKQQPGLCRPQPDPDREGYEGYDHLFDGNSIVADEETELLKLIELQKARIGISFTNERNLAMLMRDNTKDVAELRELLMSLAKLRGLVGNSMNVNLHGYGDTVRDDLKSIQHDESQRNVIATLIADMAVQANG